MKVWKSEIGVREELLRDLPRALLWLGKWDEMKTHWKPVKPNTSSHSNGSKEAVAKGV